MALEAIKGVRTVNEIAARFSLHPNQVAQWKRQAVEELPQVFSDRRVKREQAEEEVKAQLYQGIGQLKVELDWLKKRSGLSA